MDSILTGARPQSEYKIAYRAPGESGSTWNLATPIGAERQGQSVLLLKGGTEDFDAQPALTKRATVNGFGERAIAANLPSFGSSIKVLIGKHGIDLREADRAWRQAWQLVIHNGELPNFDPFDPTLSGRFIISETGGRNLWLPVYATEMSSLDANYRGRRTLESTITWESLAGTYFGSKITKEGTFVLTVPGDTYPAARLRWDTSQSGYVAMPNGQSLTLEPGPGTSGIRYINLERGYAGQVTREDGTVDTEVWSQLRGAVLGIHLTPHEEINWAMTIGLSLEVVPRHLSPWR
ncbi:hypothetical protein [Corynebacterium sp.]|uniref:hypothetical protein n=1 Tax=Corynebacterium sp. TaxID=1720 RepID=UPI0028B1DC96|nr:hypothetical protein [Corynebacterium sp.]